MTTLALPHVVALITAFLALFAAACVGWHRAANAPLVVYRKKLEVIYQCPPWLERLASAVGYDKSDALSQTAVATKFMDAHREDRAEIADLRRQLQKAKALEPDDPCVVDAEWVYKQGEHNPYHYVVFTPTGASSFTLSLYDGRDWANWEYVQASLGALSRLPETPAVNPGFGDLFIVMSGRLWFVPGGPRQRSVKLGLVKGRPDGYYPLCKLLDGGQWTCER